MEPLPTDVAVAEYAALRAEILGRRETQKNLVSITLTSFTALFAFAIGEQSNVALLLLIPPLGLAICLLQLVESVQIRRLGSYISSSSIMNGHSTWDWYRQQDRKKTAVIALLADGIFRRSLSEPAWVP